MRRDDGLTPERFDETEAQARAIFNLTKAVFIVALVVAVAAVGLVGWAVVELVQWVTSQ